MHAAASMGSQPAAGADAPPAQTMVVASSALSAQVRFGMSAKTGARRETCAIGSTVVPPTEGRRFVVTTVIRGEPLGAVSGMVYVVDADAPRVLMAAPVFETPWAAMGTNARGGHRGGRGIAASGDRLAIANADEVHVFDRAWQRVAVLTHPLLGDIHDLEPASGGIWACSTRADSLVRLGWDGELRERWSFRDDPALLARFGYRTVAPLDETRDYRDMRQVDGDVVDLTHLNNVCAVDDGLLVSLGRVRLPSPSPGQRVLATAARAAQAAGIGRGAAGRLRAGRIARFGADPQPGVDRRGMVVHLRPGRPAATLFERRLAKWPNHNIVEHGSEIVLCDTSRGLVVAADRATGAERVVEVAGAELFLRGLAHLDEDRFLVGTRRPGALHVADLASARSAPLISLSGERHEAVHDIARLPDTWDDPPSSLA
jgi:hypothetical protein